MTDKALTPIEQKTVIFYEDELTAVLVDVDGSQEVYVPVRPICEHLGVSWPSQSNRINRDPILSEVKGVFTMNTPGGQQAAVCLPLDYLNGWLFKMDAARVKPEIKERLLRYQRECYRVLANAFIRPAGESAVYSPNPMLLQVREMGLAIARMAEEQMEFDRRLAAAEGTLEIVATFDERLTIVEKQLFPGDPVTQSQAMQVSQAVKTVAFALGKKTGRNEFGAIYGELYRRYEINSYKMLPANKFEDAMSWLNEWLREVTAGDVPF